MSATRQKRKSRTGTPQDTPSATPPLPDARREKLQSSLDAWVEPAPQNPTPSFQEHGLARHGVLESMAPLGTLPSLKTRQKMQGGLGVRRSLLSRQRNAFVGDDDGTTPETTPVPELARDDSERPEDEDEDIPVPFFERDEDEDEDYRPTKKKVKTAHGTKTPIRGKGAMQAKTSAQAKSPPTNGIVLVRKQG